MVIIISSDAAVDEVQRNRNSITQRALSACELASRVGKFEFREGVNGPQISPMKCGKDQVLSYDSAPS